MYYLAETKSNSILNEIYIPVTTYWSFESLEQLNIAIHQCLTSRSRVFKKDIPVNSNIKTFSYFKDIGYKCEYLKMIEK